MVDIDMVDILHDSQIL